MPSIFCWVIVQFYAISVLRTRGFRAAAMIITSEKNGKTMTQKTIDGIKAYLKNVEGWQQPYYILPQ